MNFYTHLVTLLILLSSCVVVGLKCYNIFTSDDITNKSLPNLLEFNEEKNYSQFVENIRENATI